MTASIYKASAFFLLVLIFLGVMAPGIAMAQPDTSFFGPVVPCRTSKNPEPCEFRHLIIGVEKLINLAIAISIPLAAIGFTWAGFLYVTAAGDSGKVAQAHTIFKNIAIGFIIVLGAWLIVFAITKALLDPGFGNLPIDIER